MLDRIEFLVGEALNALRRNIWMTFAAITTSAVALFLLGGLGIIFLAFSNFMTDLGKKAEMKVMLSDKISDKDAVKLGDKILKIDGVSSIEFVSRDKGLKEMLVQNPDLDVEGLEIDNPLPNSYVVRVKDLRSFENVAGKLQKMQEVEPNGVKFPKEEKNFLADSIRVFQWLGLVLGSLMLVTSGVLIYNTIRMSVVSRRREIRIMQLVGATRFIVWAPMLLEGIIQGTFGGILATFVLWSAHTVVQRAIVQNLSAFGSGGQFPLQQAFLVLCIAGAIYGLVCSLIAVREPLQLGRKPA